MIIVTSSRRPSPRVRSLVKDLSSVLPGAERLTRGHYSMQELASEALLRGADRVVVIGGLRGNPSIMRVYEVKERHLVNIVTFIIKGLALSRELRRPLPDEHPRGIIVEVDDDPLSEEFADAFVKAFRARVWERPSDSDILAIFSAEGEGVVRLEFKFRGQMVGPRLRLAKPRRMVKTP